MEFTRRKMKVLLFVHDLSLGGAPRVALNTFRYLPDEVDLRVIALDGGPLLSQFEMYGEVMNIKVATFRYHPLRVVARIRRKLLIAKCNKWIAHFKPDLVHLNSVAVLQALGVISVPHIPMVIRVHEFGLGFRRFWERDSKYLFGRNVKAIVVSQATLDPFLKTTGFDIKRTSVVYPCVEEPEIEKPAIRDGPFIVGGAGTVEWRKGLQAWLLMAAALVRKLGPDTVRLPG